MIQTSSFDNYTVYDKDPDEYNYTKAACIMYLHKIWKC